MIKFEPQEVCLRGADSIGKFDHNNDKCLSIDLMMKVITKNSYYLFVRMSARIRYVFVLIAISIISYHPLSAAVRPLIV